MLLISIHFQSHHPLGLEIWVSPPSMSLLIFIQALILASHLIPSDVSTPSRSRKLHLGCFQVTLNPSRSQNVDVKCFQVLSYIHPGPKILVSPTSMYRLTSIQVPRFHQGHNIHASPPSRSCLTSIQISRIASQPHHSPISPYPGLKMCIPSQSRSDLTHIHVSRICASPPYRHLDSRLHSINSVHHLNPGLFIFKSPPFMYCLISILAHVFASHLHRLHNVHASRLLVAYH